MSDDYVTTESGTGLVHQAPAFGEDDHRAFREAGLEAFACPVTMYGIFTDELGVGATIDPFSGGLLATSWGTGFRDFDCDGWLDLYVGNGHVPADSAIANGLYTPNTVYRHQGPSLEYVELDVEAARTADADPGAAEGGRSLEVCERELLALDDLASALTLGGLLKHMAYVEDDWSHRSIAGLGPPEPWASVDWKANRDWELDSAADDSPEELFAIWEGSIARSQAIIDEAIADRGLDGQARVQNVAFRYLRAEAQPSQRYHLRGNIMIA